MHPFGRGMIPGMIPPPGFPPPPPLMHPSMHPPMHLPPHPFPPPLLPFGAPMLPNQPMFMRPIEQITTVYVGKIPPGVEDDFIKLMLQQCGKVANWRRVADPVSGKLKGFGFCDYQSPEGVLRALRLLTNFKIDERDLLLTVDEKTQKYLETYQKAKAASLQPPLDLNASPSDQNTSSEEPTGSNAEEGKASLTDQEKQEDERVATILWYMRMKREKGQDYRLTEVDDLKFEAIKSEVEAHKATLLHSASSPVRGESGALHSREDTSQSASSSSTKAESSTTSMEDEKQLALEKDRENEREQRRKEREEREYRDRERNWEARERTKDRDRARDREREYHYRRGDPDREIRDLAFDDYHWKYSRDYPRWKRDIQRELADDNYDRQREREEEEEKRKELQRQQERAARRAARSPSPFSPPSKAPASKTSSGAVQSPPFIPPPPPPPLASDLELFTQRTALAQSSEGALDRSKLSGFSIPASAPEKKSVTLAPGFSDDTEVEDLFQKKKRKLITLDTALHEEDGEKSEKSAKLRKVESVIEKIPKEKAQLFEFSIDWSFIDQNNIVEKKLRPWIGKKIVDYLGGEEKSLIDFIVSKIVKRTPPSDLISQLTDVLDEDAEAFVVRLWRMLIFEYLSFEQQNDNSAT